MPKRETPEGNRSAHADDASPQSEATKARGSKPTGETPKSQPNSKALAKSTTQSGAQAKMAGAAQDIGSFIRSQREAAEVSIRQLADRAGVSNPYLSQIERGLRKPSAEVLAQIAKGLRLSAEVLYVQAGILEVGETDRVRDAILTAPELSERQREILLEIYETFRNLNSAEADRVVDVA